VPTWLLFLIPSLIWGSTWLAIKFQLGTVAPELSVVYRFGLASLVLFGWCALRGTSLRFDRRTHAKFALIGGLTYALNYVLVYASEQYLTSGLIAVIYVLIVFWSMLGARVLFRQLLPARVLFGAVVGMLGVLLVFWPELARVSSAPTELWGAALAVGGTLAASAGALWSQRVYAGKVPVTASTAWAMGYATLAVAAYCWLRAIPLRFEVSFRYIASLAYLALFGSVVAFVCYLNLLRRIGAGRAGYTAAVIPILAMLTSTVFEGYRWSLPALAGMALVAFGNVLVLRRRGAA
jgi:drug/metabolite transporter (DMT)-like permease